MHNLTVTGIAGLPAAAGKILATAGKKRVFAFYGEMGAGKTTLIKAMCSVLGVKNTTSSPTFALVNEYASGNGEKIYHFDFYRLKEESEALDIGCEEYFYSDGYCFVEWPEKIPNLLPADCIKVDIKVKDGAREITWNVP